MAQPKVGWTLDDVDRLPDDGNKYELVDGELFVTPPPSPGHESLAAVLHSTLNSYVRTQGLGRVFAPRSVIRARGSEVEPDLMVRTVPPTLPFSWDQAPIPLLVVEILSHTTRRRDHEQKRAFYLAIGVAQYWIVDGESRTIRVVAPNVEDVVADNELVWKPPTANESFVLDVRTYFREALG